MLLSLSVPQKSKKPGGDAFKSNSMLSSLCDNTMADTTPASASS